MKLSVGQLKSASSVFGNVAVAWFSAGVISPLVFHPQNILSIVNGLAMAFLMAGVFFGISLAFVNRVQS